MRGGKPRGSRHGRTSAPKFTRQKVTKPSAEHLYELGFKGGQVDQEKRDQEVFDEVVDELAVLADAVDVLLDPDTLVRQVEQHLRDVA